MKRGWWVLILFLSLAVSSTEKLEALEGQFVYVLGEVTVRHEGAAAEAAIGMTVGPGDVVRTGPDGAAVISLGTQADLKLREDTILALDDLGEEVKVSLKSGGLFSRVAARLRGRYSVETQTAVAGVRGTEFFVAYGRTIDAHPDVWLCVNSGRVEVTVPASGQQVIVEEGKGINIVGGTKLTKPKPYSWTRKLNWNTDPAKGAVLDRTNLDQAYSDLLDQDYN
jgi:ferric-dicitrate binding protein FerR (iron transport regulator)